MTGFQIAVVILLVLLVVGQVINFLIMCAFANYAETVIKCLQQLITDQGDMDFHLKGNDDTGSQTALEDIGKRLGY